MKKYTLILFLIMSISLSATTINEIFMTMPDSVCPYFTSEQKMQLLEKNLMTVHNQLDGISKCESITNNSISISISEDVSWKMVIEIKNNSLSYRIEEKVCAPICTTITTIYDETWNQISLNISQWIDDAGENVYF